MLRRVKNITYENPGFCCYGEDQWRRRPHYRITTDIAGNPCELIEHAGSWGYRYASVEHSVRTCRWVRIAHLMQMKRAHLINNEAAFYCQYRQFDNISNWQR